MNKESITVGETKTVALVAHDNKKLNLLEWVDFNKEKLKHHNLLSTGTTGRLIENEIGLTVEKLDSGPLGGDQQLGSKCSQGQVDAVIFFWDPLAALPHDPDVKALLRISVVWNIPIACNRSTADFLFSSELMEEDYERSIPDYDTYKDRDVEVGQT